MGAEPAGALSAEWSAVLRLGVVTLAEPVAVLPDAAIARQRARGARGRLAELTTQTPPTCGNTAVARPATAPDLGGATRAAAAVRVRGLVAGWDPDEPTEGLDERGAATLMADLLDAAAGRTVLLLTHRTDGLDRVDQIYHLRDGRLAAQLSRWPVVAST